ncbi:IclR family transcriptional regulator [Salinirubellus sp. GCM10025818]|jgi:DNA-binding IclR family transcriptional regulator|uniref:IclR family transcriptional regulator n=1 Tax=Salinirubellus TaxID=2162630 RepID=UPI0030D24B75
MTNKGATTVGATETTLRILETLKRLDGAGVTEVANRLDIPKSTVHNHVSTLLGNEYLVKEGNTYRVGLRFLEFGEHIRNRMPIHDVARGEVERLAEESGELANLLVEEHGKGVYLCRAKGDQAVRLDTYAGMRVHLHCTALGKAILAYLPEERVREIVDTHGLPERTDATITDEEELFDELEGIRDRGYARDMEERVAGLLCVAAPIRNLDGDPLGAISVSGPTSRMKGERFDEEVPEELTSTANVIELNLNYS